jgi:hypothetical protein
VGAIKDNLSLSYRESKLNNVYLKKMSLMDNRMIEHDDLFFTQFVLTICDPSVSGLEGDPRKAYYVPVKTFTNTYAVKVKKWDGAYGNMFAVCNPEELVNWDGIVSHNNNSNIYNSWNPRHKYQYDSLAVGTMGIHRFHDIKGVNKLCSNRSKIKKGEEVYNLTQKYRLILDVVTHNVNQCLERGGLDVSPEKILGRARHILECMNT